MFEGFILDFARAHSLSPQQSALLRLSAMGVCRKEGAAQLVCSLKTVEEHWRRVYHKTGCTSEAQVVARFLRWALFRAGQIECRREAVGGFPTGTARLVGESTE